MIQFRFLTGSHSGTFHRIAQFPCSIGRNASADIRLEDSGVWDRHLEIDLSSDRSFVLHARPEASAFVNGQRTEQSILKNGDLIEIGAAKIQFWLDPTRQKDFRLREFFTWMALAILSVGQVALIYWLPW
ncbi:MAG: FHA domain-containing protein [Verrucomicrobia bacterium]|nr:FHA domain-containing protein [Verrucomicrobiota bacterium]